MVYIIRVFTSVFLNYVSGMYVSMYVTYVCLLP